ncbi:MAG: hypothetical protein IJE68_06605 [Clostridia bacterium]|nr:hypothetical protein [Clostridia bacterium]
MDRMKLFAKYAIWIILFWILSDILIYFGINSTYKDIKQRGETPVGVEIIQMQATTVNGRLKINVNDAQLSGKFLKIDLYSSTGVNLGTQYLEIGNVKENKEIETYFKIAEVKSYEITVVEEIGESTEGFMDNALSTLSVLVVLIKFFVL